MIKNNKSKIVIALAVVVMLVNSMFGIDAFAEELKIATNIGFSINEVTLDKDTKQFKADIKVADSLNPFNGLNLIISTSTKGFVSIKDVTYNIDDKSNVITSSESIYGNKHFGFLDTNYRYDEVNVTVTFEYTNEYTNEKDATIVLEKVEILYLNEGTLSKNIFLPRDEIKATRLEKYEPEKQQTIKIVVENRSGEKEAIQADVIVLKEENIPNTLYGTELTQGIIEHVGKNLEGAKVTNKTTEEGNDFISIKFKNKVDVVVEGEVLKLVEVVYDKTEKEFVPIYFPKNNFEEALRADFKHNVDFLTAFNRYREVSLDEAYCVYLETKGSGVSCKDFDGLKHDKPPFNEIGFIEMAMFRDYRIGTRFDVLRERWGIDDNYIKYRLEPYRFFGIPNSF